MKAPITDKILIKLMAALAILISISLSAQEVPYNLGFRLMDGRKKSVIPFQVHNNLIIVPVTINEWLPLKFILDTGVRTSILTERIFSDILNLKYSRKKTIIGAGGQKLVDAYIAPGVTIEMGGVKGEGHAMLVLQDDLLQLRNYLGTEVHGVLGYELFSRFIVEIDYMRRVLIIRDPKYFKPKKSYTKLGITIEDTKPYIGAIMIQKDGSEMTVKLMIDTGASHSLMLLGNTDEKIFVPAENVEANLGRGLAGDIEGKVSRISSLTMGQFVLDDPITTYPYPESYPQSDHSVYRNGTIGGGITSRFKIIFDFSKEKIYLKKNTDFKKPFRFNLSGLVVKAVGEHLNEFEVVEVRDRSGSKLAGLKPGDRILEINGFDTNRMKLENINGALNARVNKKINLIFLRNGKTYRTTFRLNSFI